jgi:hypothetical protein
MSDETNAPVYLQAAARKVTEELDFLKYLTMADPQIAIVRRWKKGAIELSEPFTAFRLIQTRPAVRS